MAPGRQKSNHKNMAAALVALLLGAVSFLVGAFLLLAGINTAGSQPQRERLVRLDASAVARGPLGVEGYVDGFLSEQNEALAGDLVAYRRHEFYSMRRRRVSDPTSIRGYRYEERPVWREVEQVTPPLLLETGDGQIQIAGDGWQIGGATTVWQAEDNSAQGPPDRYEGFPAGAPVAAIGKVADREGERVLLASAVWGGAFSDYLADHESGARFGLVAGASFLIAGLIVLLAGGLLLKNEL